MENYDITVILHPHVGEKDLQSFVQETEAYLSKENLKIENKEIKPSELLAYPIKKQTQGHLVNFSISSSVKNDILSLMNQYLAPKEGILRRLVISKPDTGKKSSQPTSVIDQLRARDKTSEKTRVETAPVKEKVPEEKKEEADLKEIDEKIEELLK